MTAEHLGALAAIAVAVAVIAFLALARPGPWTLTAARVLAVFLVANELAWWGMELKLGSFSLANSLPLQICDAAVFIAAAALWWRVPLLAEVTYFWAIAGSTQALLTPTLEQHFPNFLYFQFYVAHGGVVAAALLLVLGLKCTPRRGAVLRVYALTALFALVAGLADWLLDSDYMFLRRPPQDFSLLNLMGAWPWYIPAAAALALLLFLALDLPFWRSRQRAYVELRSQNGTVLPTAEHDPQR